MGCFSYLCKGCNESIKSDSFSGQDCYMFLLKKGKVDQYMAGPYNSYGAVFDDNGSDAIEWRGDWGKLVTLHFNDNKNDGFAVYHKKCYDEKLPMTISDDDPNQGWGDYEDDE